MMMESLTGIAVLAYAMKKTVDIIHTREQARVHFEVAKNMYEKANLLLATKKNIARIALQELGKVKISFYKDQFIPLIHNAKSLQISPFVIQTVQTMEEILPESITVIEPISFIHFGAFGTEGVLTEIPDQNTTVRWLTDLPLPPEEFGNNIMILGGVKYNFITALQAVAANEPEEQTDLLEAHQRLGQVKQFVDAMEMLCNKLDHLSAYVRELTLSLETVRQRFDLFFVDFIRRKELDEKVTERVRRHIKASEQEKKPHEEKTPEEEMIEAQYIHEMIMTEHRKGALMINLVKVLDKMLDTHLFDSDGTLTTEFTQIVHEARGVVGQLKGLSAMTDEFDKRLDEIEKVNSPKKAETEKA